ncbi:Mediator of RNA polymerase II transcription subunit 6, partial [Fragariocoptes setiger]
MKRGHAMDNPLHITFHDSALIPTLNHTNVLDYFCRKANPFYDVTCNNELAKMQRLSPEKIALMTGIEYVLCHYQDPILYIIRKQFRRVIAEEDPDATIIERLSEYYIIAGTVYQAPHLSSVVNSRLTGTLFNMQKAFEEFYKLHVTSIEEKCKLNGGKIDDKPPEAYQPMNAFQANRTGHLVQMLANVSFASTPETIDENSSDD